MPLFHIVLTCVYMNVIKTMSGVFFFDINYIAFRLSFSISRLREFSDDLWVGSSIVYLPHIVSSLCDMGAQWARVAFDGCARAAASLLSLALRPPIYYKHNTWAKSGLLFPSAQCTVCVLTVRWGLHSSTDRSLSAAAFTHTHTHRRKTAECSLLLQPTSIASLWPTHAPFQFGCNHATMSVCVLSCWHTHFVHYKEQNCSNICDSKNMNKRNVSSAFCCRHQRRLHLQIGFNIWLFYKEYCPSLLWKTL
jgi:hypothetical protein